MTKKEIVKTISEEIGLTQLKTKEIVQKTFDAIVETLVEDHRIELRNFGVFEVKRRAARKARNPRTGDKVFVPEKFVVTFKPGKEMEERVREMESPSRRTGRSSDFERCARIRKSFPANGLGEWPQISPSTSAIADLAFGRFQQTTQLAVAEKLEVALGAHGRNRYLSRRFSPNYLSIS